MVARFRSRPPVLDRRILERAPILGRLPHFRCYRWPIRHTAIYVVRHCEVGAGTNPSLTAAGQQRAALLARKLTVEAVDAVFVTQFARTQQTGAPAAAAAGISMTPYDAGAPNEAVDQVLADHVGGRVLIVGHSNTVDDICSHLGVSGVSELGHGQFGRLFVVNRFADTAHLEQLRYGAAT